MIVELLRIYTGIAGLSDNVLEEEEAEAVPNRTKTEIRYA